MEHKGTITIETENLILRAFVLSDIPYAFTNWTSDPKVTKFLTWPTHSSLQITEQVITNWISRYAEPNYYQWTIVPKELGEPIGTISVVHMEERINMAHIGYCIGSQWWHRGYTSEAFSAIISFLFEEVKFERIETVHDINNPNSGKVMQKCGLKYEGTLRKGGHNNQGIVDVSMYSILAEDYFADRS